MKVQDRALMKLMLDSLIELSDQLRPFASDVYLGEHKLDNNWQHALDRANRVIRRAKIQLSECDITS